MFRIFYIFYTVLIKKTEIIYVRIWCSWCSIADFSSACTGSSPVIRYLNVYSFVDDNMFKRIVLWLVIVIIGGCMMYYSANLVSIFWRNRWADEHLWWSRQLWMLIWFWLVVIWWLITFWIVWISDPANVDSIWFS